MSNVFLRKNFAFYEKRVSAITQTIIDKDILKDEPGNEIN